MVETYIDEEEELRALQRQIDALFDNPPGQQKRPEGYWREYRRKWMRDYRARLRAIERAERIARGEPAEKPRKERVVKSPDVLRAERQARDRARKLRGHVPTKRAPAMSREERLRRARVRKRADWQAKRERAGKSYTPSLHRRREHMDAAGQLEKMDEQTLQREIDALFDPQLTLDDIRSLGIVNVAVESGKKTRWQMSIKEYKAQNPEKWREYGRNWMREYRKRKKEEQANQCPK